MHANELISLHLFLKWPLHKCAIKWCKAFANMTYLKIGEFVACLVFFLLGKGERLKEEKGGSGM